MKNIKENLEIKKRKDIEYIHIKMVNFIKENG
jgi:hypothetical protein